MKGPRFGSRLAALGVVSGLLFLGGCGSGDVFFATGSSGSGATGGTAQGGSGGTAQGGSGGTAQGGSGGTAQGGSGGTAQGGGGAMTGGGGTGGTAQGGGGAMVGGGGTGGSTTSSTTTSTTATGECSVAADCDAAKGGPAACGTWACNMGVCSASSPGCTDADHDGFGAGAGCACAGLDCDDNDPKVGSSSSAACYTGPAGTQNVGACHGGVMTCTAGVWSPCGGEVTPSGEACNNQDDDCNGKIDDNLGTFSCGVGVCAASVPACTNGVPGVCKPGMPASATDDANCQNGAGNGKDDNCNGTVDEDCGCLAVAPNGDDNVGNGSFVLPYKTIQKAINVAAASASGPKTVCVAGQQNCGNATYQLQNGATITMADGVSVLGSYNPVGITWTRCQGITTTIQPGTPEGVTFPAAVQKSTTLDGFKVDRVQAVTTAAVTVDGAKNARLNNLTITNAPNATSSYGVNVINGGDATITQSRIDAGAGTSESIGVRSVGAKVTLQNNCATIDPNTGHCTSFCFNNGQQQSSIVGRNAGIGTTFGVLLQSSPGSKIETTAICRTQADTSAAIRVTGDATGVEIRSNNVNAYGGLNQSHGIWLDDCNDAAPWIVDNETITTQGVNGQTIVNAIRSLGACHPVIDSNKQIVGGSEGQAHNPIGIYCGLQNAVASKCVVLNNGAIKGSGACFPPTAIGVRCDDGGCNRIANNRLITGRGAATDSVGVWLGSTGTSVENNVIFGGCSGTPNVAGTATGVRTDDAYGRLENNRLFGYTFSDCNCAPAGNPPNPGNTTQSFGLRVFVLPGAHEVTVHSNDIDGAGPANVATCSSRGVSLDLLMGMMSAQRGVFRNNILRAGTCMGSRVSFLEAIAGADPRVVENNDFDPAGAPSAIYYDEGSKSLTMAAEVNALLDATVSANLSVDPMFVNYPMDVHLQAGSPCINAGTKVGAPATDMDGMPRDAMPDIGADEH